MNYKYLLFLSCFFFGINTVQSQDKSFNKAPLKKVLFVLEKEYDIKFSFSEEDVANKTISLDFKNDKLASVLEKLQELTTLQFNKITDRYITVLNSMPPINISGTLRDIKTELPLQGGTITVLNKKKGGVSDENGLFSITNIHENDTINISFLGYQNQLFLAKTFKDNPNLSIALQESSDVLSEIIIQNYLTNGMVKKDDGSEEFKPQILGILPGLTEPDVLQSIQLLPGVQSPNETASGLHIRGGTPDQNLILFDGIKMYNSAHFFGMVSAFNPYVAQKTKVFRSGTSASYGNHISGVIDIESDEVAPEKFTGGLGTNLIHADAFLKIPINKSIGFIVSGRRSFTDIFNTITFKKLSKKVFQNTVVTQDNLVEEESEELDEYNEFFYSDINAKLLIKASKRDKLSFSYLHNSNKLNYTVSEDSILDATSHFLHFFNIGMSGVWNHNWNKNLKQKTKLYYSNFDLNYYFNRKDFNSQIADAINKKNVIKEVQLQSVFNWSLKEKTTLNLGYEITNSEVGFSLSAAIDNFQESDEITFKDKNTTQAVFGEYVLTNQDKTSLHLGLRANYFSLTDDFFLSPRIYVQTKLLSNFWIKASAELKQQNTSKVVEFFTEDFGLENQVWALANEDDIPVLESSQVSIGTIFKKNKWTFDIDLYRKEINGLTSLTKGFISQEDDYSEGKSTSNGLDIFLKKEWKKYSSWVSYSLTNTVFKFDDLNNGNSFAGNYDAKHQFLWANSLKIKQFNFSLGWNFRTGIPYTNAIGLTNSNEINYETINAKRLPSYHRLDFSTTYKFNLSASKKWKGKIGFSLLNIYNQKNTLQRSYRVKENFDGSNSFVQTDTYSLGITPNFVFRVNF